MMKVAINSIGKTFSIDRHKDYKLSLSFDENKYISFDNIVNNRKKKQFYKRTTLLSLYAIKEAINNLSSDWNSYDMNRVGLYSFEKESNNFNIQETYTKLIKFCNDSKMSNDSISEILSKCYSLSDLFKLMANLSNHLISAELGIKGANKSIITGEGADLQSLIDASIDINDNKFDVILCGTSTTKYSALEQKQMANFYNYNLDTKNIEESSVYLALGKECADSSLYIRGGRSFYMKENINNAVKSEYLNSVFDDFFNNSSISKNEIDFVLYLDQYKKATTVYELDVLKEIFINSNVILPDLEDSPTVCNGLLYITLLYNNAFNFNKALVAQKNYNNIITFILITR